MLSRILEPEVMDTEQDAFDYDRMDHSAVNRVFAADLLTAFPHIENPILDVGTGTAQVPIEICRTSLTARITAIDLADAMLKLADANVRSAGLANRIALEKTNGRDLKYGDRTFAGVISNSIIHHIPEPEQCFREMVRVCRSGGALFVRDLLRPSSDEELEQLVNLHTGGANPHQRLLFSNSLRAALTVVEVRAIVARWDFGRQTVEQTSDRHWTFQAIRLHSP